MKSQANILYLLFTLYLLLSICFLQFCWVQGSINGKSFDAEIFKLWGASQDIARGVWVRWKIPKTKQTNKQMVKDCFRPANLCTLGSSYFISGRQKCAKKTILFFP